MATSNTYNFQQITADYVIRDAFQRCKIPNWKISGLDLQDALRSLNFLFSEYINYGLNLFTVQQGMIPAVEGQSKYQLPEKLMSKILECNTAKSNQILGGTASSSSGSGAGSLFSSTPGSFTTSTPNASIAYAYPSPGQPITYVGILSSVVAEYTLQIQASVLTPSGFTDTQYQTILLTPPTTYYPGVTIWYSLPYTFTAVNWQITETGGANLNLTNIFLEIPYQIQPMVAIGRDLYFQFNANNQTGVPTQYWFDRTLQPTMNVYPYADGTYQFFVYNYTNVIQDVTTFFQTLPISNRFLNAACAGLAAILAQKHVSDPDLYTSIVTSAQTAYSQAGGEDTEFVSSQFTLGLNR